MTNLLARLWATTIVFKWRAHSQGNMKAVAFWKCLSIPLFRFGLKKWGS